MRICFHHLTTSPPHHLTTRSIRAVLIDTAITARPRDVSRSCIQRRKVHASLCRMYIAKVFCPYQTSNARPANQAVLKTRINHRNISNNSMTENRYFQLCLVFRQHQRHIYYNK